MKVKLFFFSILFLVFLPSKVFGTTAVDTFGTVNPLDFPNNKVGIHILELSQIEKAAQLVNSSGGDWGYVTIVIRSDDRNITKWQKFMKRVEELHLIPIVRIATVPEGDRWKKPTKEDAKAWALFLNRLSWPVKNRYVVVYNEPNHANEWGGDINPFEYAQVLKETRDELKKVNADFFVLNGGFDAAAPTKPGYSMSEEEFLVGMERTVPGTLKLLDGWSSHSYPNPDFLGTPDDDSKISIRGYKYELGFLKSNFGVTELPVFITETGWKHMIDGDRYGYYSSEKAGDFYKKAFDGAWSDKRIVAVTPFVLGYFQEPFSRFSFLRLDGSEYPMFSSVVSITKTVGSPPKNNLDNVSFVLFDVPRVMYTGKEYEIAVHVKNTGNTTWDVKGGYGLIGKSEGEGGVVLKQLLSVEEEVVASNEVRSFKFRIIAPREAKIYRVNWEMIRDGKPFGGREYSDFFVQAAVIIFNKEYLYHVFEDMAILEPTEEAASIYKPKLLPNSIFYGLKETREGVQEFLTRGEEERGVFRVSLLENRLAEIVALKEKGKTKEVRDLVRELAVETEKLTSDVVGKPAVANIHVMKVALVKQQIILSRMFSEIQPFNREPSLRFAILTSQKSLKKIVDTEKRLNITAENFLADSFHIESLRKTLFFL